MTVERKTKVQDAVDIGNYAAAEYVRARNRECSESNRKGIITESTQTLLEELEAQRACELIWRSKGITLKQVAEA